MRGASSKQSNQPDKRNIRIVTQLQYMHATCEMLQRGPPTQLSAESTAGGQSRKWRHLSVDLIRAGSRLACNFFFFTPTTVDVFNKGVLVSCQMVSVREQERFRFST